MNKKLVIGLPLLLIGGGAGAYMTGQLDPFLGTAPEVAGEEAEPAPLPPTDTVFVPMKNIGVSVIQQGRVVQVIYLDLALEVRADGQAVVDRHWVRLRDRTQSTLLELFAYRSRRGLPPIDVPELKSVLLELGGRMFGQDLIVDVHLISDWIMEPGT